jgi:hypothetical protein
MRMEVKMKSGSKKQVPALERLAREFSNYRDQSGLYPGSKGCRYPQALKDQVIKTLQSGWAPSEVAKSAGIGKQSIVKWRKASKVSGLTVPPRELRLLADKVENVESPNQSTISSPMARLKFGLGVEVELPVSALSIDVLRSLFQLGAKRC